MLFYEILPKYFFMAVTLLILQLLQSKDDGRRILLWRRKWIRKHLQLYFSKNGKALDLLCQTSIAAFFKLMMRFIA